MEEMLHLVLAANVLNAIGGAPSHRPIPDFVPALSERRFLTATAGSSSACAGSRRKRSTTFRRIERPEPPGTPPGVEGYHTIGQFYAGIELGLQHLAAERDIFTGDPARQIAGNEHVYGMAGAPFAVNDLDSALQAPWPIIVDQGEGIDHTIHDGDPPLGGGALLAHYYRFDEIAKGRRYLPSDTPRTGPTGPPLPVDFDAVWPMRADPRVEDLPPAARCGPSPTRPTGSYTDLLALLAPRPQR